MPYQHVNFGNFGILSIAPKICIIIVSLLKYYFESHLIYNINDAIIDRQTIFNQLNIRVAIVVAFFNLKGDSEK